MGLAQYFKYSFPNHYHHLSIAPLVLATSADTVEASRSGALNLWQSKRFPQLISTLLNLLGGLSPAMRPQNSPPHHLNPWRGLGLYCDFTPYLHTPEPLV